MREALSCDRRNGLHDGTVFAGAVREFNVTLNDGASQAQTHNVWCSYLFYASGRDGYTQTCANETNDRQPLWGFLHDARAKAVFFAE